MHARQQLIAFAAMVSIAPALAEELVAVYEKDSVIVFTATREMEMTLADATVKMGDFELPPEANEALKKDTDRTEQRTLEIRNEFIEIQDGAPTKVRRTFDAIERKKSDSSGDSTLKGALVGRSLLLNQDGEKVSAKLEGSDDELDEGFLAGHELTQGVDALLPEKPIEVGDTWSISREAMAGLIGLRPSVRYFEEETDLDKFHTLVMESARIDGQAKLAAMEEHEGLRCARVEVSVELKSEVDDPTLFVLAMRKSKNVDGDISGSASVTIESMSTFWFALAQQRPVKLKSKSTGEMSFDIELKRGNFISTMDLELELSGSERATWTIED